jgi:signal transduction histidine kinase
MRAFLQQMENFLLDNNASEKRTLGVRALGKRFGDLRVRPKLIVLHNLFFLVLGCSIYFTLIPSFERRVASAKTIEVSLVTQIFAEDKPLLDLPKMESYDYREGTASALQIPADVQDWLDSHPGQVWQNSPHSDFLFRKNPRTGTYRRMTLPNLVYDAVVERAKLTVFLVLGVVYVLAVLLLELIIMPLYVYQPLKSMLDADRATQAGDRRHELIAEPLISGDEIGQIMRSRNTTVAELRKQEDHLAEALSRLEAQDRLASLGLLSASVAHEMNTPLAVLHGSVEQLLETEPDKHVQDRLERMLRVTRRLQKISEGLVDFARVRKQEMERVAIHPLIQEAWSLVAIDEKAVDVQFANKTLAEHAVTGNTDRLIQVFVNLLRNALNAVEAAGTIEVCSAAVIRDGRKMIAITVDDNGPGIPPGVLPDIFDAFVSTRLDSRGTGLGLTVAEGIVRQHDGSITAGNRTGGGARLEVILRSAE